MKFIGDFHVHSRYARATSKDMDLEHLDHWAVKKGISVMSSGDFTHPLWFKELSAKLEPAESGLFVAKGSSHKTRFLLGAEISCIYSKGGKGRRVHLLLFCPSLEAAKRINDRLAPHGTLSSDGRPMLGIDAKTVVKICKEASDLSMVVPAHAWTPWFGVLGSQSGFNSLEECFDELTPLIPAIETGLSSDPRMNWRLSSLDKVALLSNSDCHSARKIGREANVFDTELSYKGIFDAVSSKDPKKFLYTVEFFPEEGKYHSDGHRLCNVRMTPSESKENDLLCPVCKKKLTVGVLARVEELADRPEGYVPQSAIPFRNVIPLEEIISEAFGVGVASKRVQEAYESAVAFFGTEFSLLLDVPVNDLPNGLPNLVAEGIIRMREGRVSIQPGYDGEYGVIRIFQERERAVSRGQTTLL